METSEEVGTEKPSIPRMCNRQTQRSKVEADVPKVYYRRSLPAPFLDHLLQEMKDRFSTNAKVATLGLCLVPSTICKKDDWQTRVNNLASLYQDDLPAPLSLQTELHCWKHKWIHVKTDDLPDSPIEALNRCDSKLIPNIYTLLRIMSKILVMSCEAECTFSALCRLKPFLRTTMGENRLSSLTLLHVHRNILEDAVDR